MGPRHHYRHRLGANRDDAFLAALRHEIADACKLHGKPVPDLSHYGTHAQIDALQNNILSAYADAHLLPPSFSRSGIKPDGQYGKFTHGALHGLDPVTQAAILLNAGGHAATAPTVAAAVARAPAVANPFGGLITDGFGLPPLDKIALPTDQDKLRKLSEAQEGKPLPRGGFEFPPLGGQKSKGTIVLDPGHGHYVGTKNGKDVYDPGSIGPDKKLTEVQLNWDLAAEMRKQLTAKGYTVVMTKSGPDAKEEKAINLSADARSKPQLETSFSGDFFVSVHQDVRSGQFPYGNDPHLAGVRVNYDSHARPMDEAVARIIAKTSGGEASPNDRHIGVLQASLNHTRPTVLIEATDINNHNDVANIVDPARLPVFAKKLVDGIDAAMHDTDIRLAMKKAATPSVAARRAPPPKLGGSG
jgi:N-acetylmuramoyl-L-alanine amidase